MKKLIRILAVILAVGATVQAVSSFIAQADTKSTKEKGEPGP